MTDEKHPLELQMRLYALAVLLGMEPDRDTTYIEVVDRAEAEIGRLKKIVGRLPKTADGVTVVPGVRVWPRGDLFVEGEEGADVVLVLRDKITGDDMDFFRWDGLYSTRKAARDAAEAQTPPPANDEPATGMAIFDEDGNPVTDGEAGFRPLTGVCRVCGYGCCVHFSGEIKASTIECPICCKNTPEAQTPP